MSVVDTIAPPTSAPGTTHTVPRRTVRTVLLHRDFALSTELSRLIAAEPDLIAVAVVATLQEAIAKAQHLEPDVVVVDHHSSDLGDLLLARNLKALARSPGVLIHCASTDPTITLAAIVAGVDGIVDTSDCGGAIGDAIRWIAQGSRWMPEMPLSALSRIGSRINREDVPILAMLMRGTPATQIARALAVTDGLLDARRWVMVQHMHRDSARTAVPETRLTRNQVASARARRPRTRAPDLDCTREIPEVAPALAA
jgi:DNA-binding NarL/FixJ family response regulator